MNIERLPKREDIAARIPSTRDEPPSLKLYGVLLALSVILLIVAFVSDKPDWPNLFINLATDIVGAVIILALVERKLRPHEIAHLRKSANNLQTQLYFVIFPNAKRLADYLEASSVKYQQLSMGLYLERPELEHKLRSEKGDFLLLGARGTGKTTELQHLYWYICKKAIANISKERVPIFLPARWINPEVEFIQDTLRLYFEKYSKVTEKQIIKLASSGRIILIIDGLDELQLNQRIGIIKILSTFQKQYPNNQLIASADDSYNESNELSMKILRMPELTNEEKMRFLKLYEVFRERYYNPDNPIKN